MTCWIELRVHSSITSACLGLWGGVLLMRGVGGLSQNPDMLTLWTERLGEWKHRARIDVKYLKLHLVAILLEIINNQMNFLLNYAQISLITAPKPKNIFLMVIEKYILIIWNMSFKISSNSTSVQALRQQIRGVGVGGQGLYCFFPHLMYISFPFWIGMAKNSR